ncbi:MAG TPA: TA system VapC family ribonuclease toxin [Vineibacter sp.]|nr:TA system VapC family ribonuclease toxin [Vineibacter sp.]
MLVVDTNILVYAADADSPLHPDARGWLERQRQRPDAWYSTWPILYEFMRVTTHPQVMKRPLTTSQSWRFVSALLESPGFGVLVPTERHASVVEQVIGEIPYIAGNLLHDTHTAVLMREHGIRRICTRDMDFHRFSYLEVVDPSQA